MRVGNLGWRIDNDKSKRGGDGGVALNPLSQRCFSIYFDRVVEQRDPTLAKKFKDNAHVIAAQCIRSYVQHRRLHGTIEPTWYDDNRFKFNVIVGLRSPLTENFHLGVATLLKLGYATWGGECCANLLSQRINEVYYGMTDPCSFNQGTGPFLRPPAMTSDVISKVSRGRERVQTFGFYYYEGMVRGISLEDVDE